MMQLEAEEAPRSADSGCTGATGESARGKSLGFSSARSSTYVRRNAVLSTAAFLFVLGLALLLATVVAAQKKVSVSEVVFDSSVEDIQWVGSDHKTLLVKTTGGRLFRSYDSGKVWTEISDVLASKAGKGETSVRVQSLMVSPVDKNVVIVMGNKNVHFVTDDAARTFRRIEHQTPIHNFLFHPTRPQWSLLSAWSEACSRRVYSDAKKKGETECNHVLYVTKDLGRSFSKVTDYVVQFSWGDPKLKHQDRVYFTYHRSRSGMQPRTGGWSQNVDFAYTDDFGRTLRRMVHRGNKFLASSGYIFVAKLIDVDKQTVELMVSSDGSSFKPAKLPQRLMEKSYTVLDTSEGAVMIHVNHGNGRETGKLTGNVYISDAAGLRYSLSLPDNVRTDRGECEFDKVMSLEGVYIANFMDRNKPADASPGSSAVEEADKQEEDEEESALETDVDRKKRKQSRGRSEDVIRTVITFDKGGVWSFLKPPMVDSRGKKVECPTKQCYLHLHGITNFNHYAPFYSVDNAVGIIMGTGNVGSNLRYGEDETNTYLSRDGGLTWVEAHKGAYIYEFGDHGGLIVMADDVRKTNQVVFSWNEGQSWYDFDLGEQPVDVDNIVIEPNSSSVEFLLYGTRGGAGVLYHLDFGALGQPACKGVWAADSVSSDYETWTPADGRTVENCILGRQMTYTRRKQTSECFNGRDFSRPTQRKNCTCTKEDYECEFGFTRKVESPDCIPQDPTLTTEGCTTSKIFYADAYRKVPGDTCIDGWVPEKVPVPCPHNSPFSRGAKLVLFTVVGSALTLISITYLSRNPRFRHLLANAGFESFGNVKYSQLGGRGGESPFEYGGGAVKETDLGFIEAEQDGVDEEDDPPSLMSFSTDRMRVLETDGEGTRARRGIAAATEAVPRLAPPPTGLGKIQKELELL